jgi:hypothetical protein
MWTSIELRYIQIITNDLHVKIKSGMFTNEEYTKKLTLEKKCSKYFI